MLLKTAEKAQARLEGAAEDATGAIDQKVKEMQKLLQGHSQLSVLESPHVVTNRHGNITCSTCTQYSHVLKHKRQLGSKFLPANGGIEQDKRLVRLWQQHVTSGAPPPLCHISFTTLPVKNRPFDTTFLGLGLRL